MVGVALLWVSAVTSVSVPLVACLGSRRVTVVVAVSRGVVGVLLVLRVGGVVLGVNGLLPDLILRGKSGSGASSASDDATSNGRSDTTISGINLAYDEGSADKGVGATEVHEQVGLDASDRNTSSSIVGFVGNHASFGVGVWVDDTVPLLLQRVEDATKSGSLILSVHGEIAGENTISVREITSSVDVELQFTIIIRCSCGSVSDLSSDGGRSVRVLSDLDLITWHTSSQVANGVDG